MTAGMMRAVVADGAGGPEVLTIVEMPVPRPGPGEVLVKVRAAGVNRADVMQRQGVYAPPDGKAVLGLELSGEVAALGEGVSTWTVGEPVVALVGSGAYAEYAVAPAGQLASAPEGMSLVDAAGVIEVAATVWSNVFELAALRRGERILVHGGASGIGTMAIQLARAHGARIATTVGSREKERVVKELGADIVIDYRSQDFTDVLRSGGFVPDVILDVVGAPYLRPNVELLGTGGRLVVIGLQGGQIGEMPIGDLLYKQGSVFATSLRARPNEQKAEIVAATVAAVWPMLADGTVRPIISDRHALEEVAQAHRGIEDPGHVGKQLLTMG